MQPPAPFDGNKLEVLHRVRHVDPSPVDSRRLQASVQQTAGRSDEGMSLTIFLISWLFTDEHDIRRARTFTEDGLSSVDPQIAAATALYRFAHLGKRWVRGDEIRSRNR
jgi:hypothetical protein